jgi:hypothetical protein
MQINKYQWPRKRRTADERLIIDTIYVLCRTRTKKRTILSDIILDYVACIKIPYIYNEFYQHKIYERLQLYARIIDYCKLMNIEYISTGVRDYTDYIYTIRSINHAEYDEWDERSANIKSIIKMHKLGLVKCKNESTLLYLDSARKLNIIRKRDKYNALYREIFAEDFNKFSEEIGQIFLT